MSSLVAIVFDWVVITSPADGESLILKTYLYEILYVPWLAPENASLAYGRGRALRGAGDGRDQDDSWASLHHVPRESGEALVGALRPAHVEHIVAALDQAVAAQALFEGIDESRAGFRRPSWGGQRPSLAGSVAVTGPNPGRPLPEGVQVAYPLEDYRRRTAWVRGLYDRVVPG